MTYPLADSWHYRPRNELASVFLALLTLSAGTGRPVLPAIRRVAARLNHPAAATGAVTGSVALNTAVSFVTNTNWQAYRSGSALSCASQPDAGLTVQNFLSAATGIAVFCAASAPLRARSILQLGNAGRSGTRYAMDIISCRVNYRAVFFLSTGRTAKPVVSAHHTTLEGAKQLSCRWVRLLRGGDQMLGTSGGGFFNANSSHPFRKPTPRSLIWRECCDILIQPRSVVSPLAAANVAVRDARYCGQCHSFCGLRSGSDVGGSSGEIPHLCWRQADSNVSMEGKETRFGVLWQPVCRRHDRGVCGR